MRVGGESQVTNPPHRRPLSSFLSPHSHQRWAPPQRSCRPEAMDCLVTIHGCISQWKFALQEACHSQQLKYESVG